MLTIMELEIKYKVEFFPYKLVIDMGFVEIKKSHQIDRYYIVDKLYDSQRTYLRLREDVLDRKYSFDYHQIVSELATKETEILLNCIQDIKSFDYILNSLGLKNVCIVNKQRSVFQKDNCKVIFDKVANLGCFVEIEIEGEESDENISIINNLSRSLNLQISNKILNAGYPDLILNNTDYV